MNGLLPIAPYANFVIMFCQPSIVSLASASLIEPVGVEAFGAEAAGDGLDKGIVGPLAGPGEVERNTALVGPKVQPLARHKLDCPHRPGLARGI